MSKITQEHRRNFLKALGGVCAGGAAYALLPQLEMVGRLLAAEPGQGEYRALVCIYLNGGSDSFNMLVPHDTAEYAIYSKSRGGTYHVDNNRAGLGIARDALLQITDKNNKVWGLHPSCAGLQRLFGNGELGFLANVGTLTEPLSKDEYVRSAKTQPLELFSHNSQTVQWMRGTSERNVPTGWGGRVADRLRGLNAQTPLLPPSISVTGGGSLFQTGAVTMPFSMFASGPTSSGRFNRGSSQGAIRYNALDELLGREYDALMENRFSLIAETSLELGHQTSEWLKLPAGTVQTTFPASNRLADQLKMIARLIKLGRSSTVGHKRQIFFASLGGFDTHRDQMTPTVQPALLKTVSDAVSAFRDALVEIGALDNVMTFSISDFSRTLNSNGSGTDHGWGSVQFVMGGSSLQGGRVWGQYPLLELNGAQSLARGQMVPTTSVVQYGATLANWVGVPRAELPVIFPSLSRFSPDLLPFLA
jgi:uncharacterized protein (DUF1501 family)